MDLYTSNSSFYMRLNPHSIRCVLLSLFTCAGCLFLQGHVYTTLRTLNARFVSPIGEENTLIRLQNSHRLTGDVLFMGSSLTERLLSHKKYASIALPGSPFTSSLSLLNDPHQFSPGTVYILETNNMFSKDNESVILRTKKWDFDIFRDSIHFSIAAKPLNLLVTCIFYITEHNKNLTDDIMEEVNITPQDLTNTADISVNQLIEWQSIINGINELRARNGKICFVYLPCKNRSSYYEDNYEKACILAKHLNIPVLNYNESKLIDRLHYTDSSHLNSRKKSTIMFMNTVARDAKMHAR